MIQRLHIRNYAIIEELDLDFSQGLTIITGETGAGKSILLGALGLVMGNRADTKSLYNESEKCIVEAYFSVERYGLESFFMANDIDYDAEMVIRRELTPSGKSRAFVNDTPVTLKVLQDLSGALIDLHEQFDTLDINNLSFQLRMLDALAGNRELLTDYQAQFRNYQELKRQLENVVRRNQEGTREAEFVSFQLDELQKATLEAGEEESLEEELIRLSHAEEIQKTLSAAFQLLSENEPAVLSQLDELAQSLAQIGRFDPEVKAMHERLHGVKLELRDLANECERLAEQTESDPERIFVVQQRLDVLNRLQHKHNVASTQELIALRDQLEAQLQGYADLDEEMARLQAEIAALEARLLRLAQALSERRQAVIPDFSTQVVRQLGNLAMEHARMEVQVTAMSDLGPSGWDEVTFLFAANKGSRLQAIKEVASGGELSRLALVIKSLVASAIPLPTLIFDEIDTGISGDVALRMGNILRELSNEHQVVTITHSPQVAAKADRHYFVYKHDREDRTVTMIRELDQDGRIRAIATMLSQSPPSEMALANARELLELI